MFIEISAYQCTCERCDYQWSALKIPKTCAKCRSPYWNEPRGGISPAVTTLLEKPLENKKNSAASPERSYSERAQLPLDDPEHPMNEQPWNPRVPTDYIRFKSTGEEPSPEKRQTIEELKAQIASIPAHKPVTPEYKKPVVIEDQPSFDELNTVDYGEI